MIKISKLADYAVVILAAMPENTETLMSAAEISEKTHLPVPTVAKVLKLLAKAYIIDSVRGASGGYRLASSRSRISIASIITAVDGPISLTACVEGSAETCEYAGCCSVKGRWDHVNAVIMVALNELALKDMLTRTQSGIVFSQSEIQKNAGKENR